MTDLREIRIYVACLASYNNGILHGRWIDATLGEDHIWDEVKAMLAVSPIANAEEHAIHDYEGFEGLSILEYQDFSSIAAMAEFIEQHGTLGASLIGYYGEIDDARLALEDHYAGSYPSIADFAQELTEETTDIPQSICLYVNYEKIGRDLEISDVLSIESGGMVHVFWNH